MRDSAASGQTLRKGIVRGDRALGFSPGQVSLAELVVEPTNFFAEVANLFVKSLDFVRVRRTEQLGLFAGHKLRSLASLIGQVGKACVFQVLRGGTQLLATASATSTTSSSWRRSSATFAGFTPARRPAPTLALASTLATATTAFTRRAVAWWTTSTLAGFAASLTAGPSHRVPGLLAQFSHPLEVARLASLLHLLAQSLHPLAGLGRQVFKIARPTPGLLAKLAKLPT